MQVLIFSQFKIMLDILEDYLQLMGWPMERIDGSVAQLQRQAAIDRFSKGVPCPASVAVLVVMLMCGSSHFRTGSRGHRFFFLMRTAAQRTCIDCPAFLPSPMMWRHCLTTIELLILGVMIM